jgi:hypothetical protein
VEARYESSMKREEADMGLQTDWNSCWQIFRMHNAGKLETRYMDSWAWLTTVHQSCELTTPSQLSISMPKFLIHSLDLEIFQMDKRTQWIG